jgi:RNA polymerase sigma factor (TIGR02999 family)
MTQRTPDTPYGLGWATAPIRSIHRAMTDQTDPDADQPASRGTNPAPPAEMSDAFYRQLRVLARARLRDGGRNTLLDTTALVHEAYLRMAGRALGLKEQRQLMAYASRTSLTQRRGGDLFFVTFTGAHEHKAPAGAADIVRVHEALGDLEKLDPRLAGVVEMRYFGGLSDEQIAQTLGVSDRTVRRDWEKARLLLETALQG